ncbi:MAG TPA: winged helix-turn-helix domain-containing protein, partial [Steroidobacteraceae bacterium]
MSLEPASAPTFNPDPYRVGDLLVDVGLRRVTRAGLELSITRRSFDLLLALVHAAPNVMTVKELMDQVWPGVVVSPETVIQRIMLLRQGLGDSADIPRYVAAVRGHGYRMAAPVNMPAVLPAQSQPTEAETSASTVAMEAATADALEPSPAEPAGRAAPGTHRRIPVGLAGVLALVIGA